MDTISYYSCIGLATVYLYITIIVGNYKFDKSQELSITHQTICDRPSKNQPNSHL